MLGISRPNFFPGQLIDYRDFNRLSSQADKVHALLTQHLFTGGGIVMTAMDEFRVVPLSETSVLVKPGVALLPDGRPVILSEEKVVDLSPYCVGKTPQLIVVSIRNVIRGKEKYVDDQDPAICGYKTEAFEPEIVMTVAEPPEDGIEIFRVSLKSKGSALRLADNAEQWENLVENSGVIDLRNRRSIIPQTYFPLSTTDFVALRQALYQLSDSHRKLSKLFFLEDSNQTTEYLTQLHAELLNRPYQPIKTAFLASEFCDKLALFLDALSRKAKKGKGNFDEAVYLDTIGKLESLKGGALLPRDLKLMDLISISNNVRALVRYAESKYDLFTRIEEALVDLKDRSCDFGQKISLAGQLFEQSDMVGIEDEKRLAVTSKMSQMRRHSAKYKNGEALSQTGMFIKDGKLSLTFNVPHPDRPIVVIAPQYVRRGGTVVHYEINGKHVATDQWSADMRDGSEVSNHWANKGLVISSEFLVAQENRLQIRIEKSDLDYGFFGVYIYQPQSGVIR